MHRVLIRKCIGDSLMLFLACGVVLFAFAWLRVWVVSLLDMGQFGAIMDQLREFERFAPIGFDAMLTYPGRVGMTYDEPIVILCTVIWCIARGSDVISGEIARGTMEFMMAQPIRRITLLASHALVAITGLGLLCLLVWGGIAVGIQATTVTESLPPPTFRIPLVNLELPLQAGETEKLVIPLRERVDAWTYASSTFHLFAFGFFLLGLSTLFSSVDRYRWRTIGMVVGVYVLQLVTFALGKAADSLQWLMSLSFFNCYKPQKMTSIAMNEGLAAPWSFSQVLDDGILPPVAYPLILLTLGAVCFGIAIVCFQRRDLPAPL